MELKDRIRLICWMILIAACIATAATQKIFIDTTYNTKQIFNVSNLTISERFTDGTLLILSGDINSADHINASRFYQGGNLVVDTATVLNLSSNYSSYANSSEYWDNWNTPEEIISYYNLYNASQVNQSEKNWSLLYGYPAACPSNTYVSTLDDSVTCTGVADIYAFNTGDNLTGNYNMTGNLTQGDNVYHVFGDDNDASIHYNGSALVIKVN